MANFETHWDKDKIKALRVQYGLTQAQIAERLKIRQQTWSEWECGKYLPRRASTFLLDSFAEELKNRASGL